MLTHLVALVAAPIAAPEIGDVLPRGFRDATFVSRIEQGNQRELAKINDDFAQSYRFRTTTVRMKEPFKLRLEATIEDTSIVFVVNGTRRMVRAPRSNINIRENLATKPGKRQTILDFGLVAPSLFGDLFQAKFVREDRATGDYVFDLTYVPSLKDGTRNRVWIDPKQRFVSKREWYSQLDGRLQATFFYTDPVQQDGVFFPTKVTVRNADDKVAGVTRYTQLKINAGLAESLFDTN